MKRGAEESAIKDRKRRNQDKFDKKTGGSLKKGEAKEEEESSKGKIRISGELKVVPITAIRANKWSYN